MASNQNPYTATDIAAAKPPQLKPLETVVVTLLCVVLCGAIGFGIGAWLLDRHKAQSIQNMFWQPGTIPEPYYVPDVVFVGSLLVGLWAGIWASRRIAARGR